LLAACKNLHHIVFDSTRDGNNQVDEMNLILSGANAGNIGLYFNTDFIAGRGVSFRVSAGIINFHSKTSAILDLNTFASFSQGVSTSMGAGVFKQLPVIFLIGICHPV
jgi:hypothetical protein